MNRGALLLVLYLVTALYAMPARAQNVPAQCDLSTSTKAQVGQDEDKRPIVFVHGWTGSPLTGSAKALSGALDGKISTYAFDYGEVSSPGPPTRVSRRAWRPTWAKCRPRTVLPGAMGGSSSWRTPWAGWHCATP